MGSTRSTPATIAMHLCDLYERSFGGKDRGRYRISRKLLRKLAGRERLPDELMRDVTDELFERGFILIDMESFFVLLEQRLFHNYRRVPESAVNELSGREAAA